MQVTIQKWGNSQGIRIPKALLEALGMTENDLVELNRVDDNIVITKVKEKKEVILEDIFKDYDGEYAVEELTERGKSSNAVIEKAMGKMVR